MAKIEKIEVDVSPSASQLVDMSTDTAIDAELKAISEIAPGIAIIEC